MQSEKKIRLVKDGALQMILQEICNQLICIIAQRGCYTGIFKTKQPKLKCFHSKGLREGGKRPHKTKYCFECSTMSLWWSPTIIDGSVSELRLPFQVYQLWHICSMSVKLKLQKPRERKSCWPELLSVCRTIKNSENVVTVNHSLSTLEESNLLVSGTRRLVFCQLKFCELLTLLETNQFYPNPRA